MAQRSKLPHLFLVEHPPPAPDLDEDLVQLELLEHRAHESTVELARLLGELLRALRESVEHATRIPDDAGRLRVFVR